MTTKPWRRPQRPQRPDTLVSGDDRPLATISIYKEMALYTRHDGDARRQQMIDLAALAQTLAAVPMSSGLLPPHTLAAGVIHGRPSLVTWIAPRRATLRTPYEEYTVPLPPLVWAGWRDQYRIFALGDAAYPARSDLPLYAAPFPNVYNTMGGICWGDTDQRPAAGPQTMAQALELFLTGSLFNMHLAAGKSVAYPSSVLTRWSDLAREGAESYPLDDLVSSEYDLGWLLSGSAWTGKGL